MVKVLRHNPELVLRDSQGRFWATISSMLVQLRLEYPEHNDVTLPRVVAHCHSANGAAHVMLSAESEGLHRRICAIEKHSYGHDAPAASSASAGSAGLSSPPLPRTAAPRPPPGVSQSSTRAPCHPAPSRGAAHARDRVQGGLDSRPPKRPRHAPAAHPVSVPSPLGPQIPPFGIIAVNHVTRGQICSRVFGPSLPREPGLPRRTSFAFRLLDAASCPSSVPPHLLAPANIIVWVDLAKARSLGYRLKSDQPGHSLLSNRRRWIHCNVVALARSSDQV